MKVNKKKLKKSIAAIEYDYSVYLRSYREVDGQVKDPAVVKHMKELAHAVEILRRLA